MNDIKKVIEEINKNNQSLEWKKSKLPKSAKETIETVNSKISINNLIISALKKQIPKKVYHFLEDDTFETTCCKSDVTNQDYTYCPNCGSLLGEVEEVEE